MDEAEWTLKLSKRDASKSRREDIDDYLIVPLSLQAVKILRATHAFTGDDMYVFPGGRDLNRPMSENAILAARRRMGIPKDQMCGHGFRATARTILRQELKIREDIIEHQLGHKVIDPNGRDGSQDAGVCGASRATGGSSRSENYLARSQARLKCA